MSVRQYIGARYVTKIYENTLNPSSAEWEASVNYEPLTMVTYNNGSYLSKKEVPASVGNPAANPTYWAQTGFYNGQIAQLQDQITDIYNNLYVTPEMFGAVGDGVTDDSAALQSALDSGKNVVFMSDYRSSVALELDHYVNIDGCGHILTTDADAFYIKGRYINISNLNIYSGTSGQNTCISAIAGASDVYQLNMHDVVIAYYNIGIEFNVIFWNNSFNSLRIDNCITAIKNTGSGRCHSTLFENIHTNHCHTNVYLTGSVAAFNSCNFGVDTFDSTFYFDNSRISLLECSIECDVKNTNNGVLFALHSGTCDLINSRFLIMSDDTGYIFNFYGIAQMTIMNSLITTKTGNAMANDRLIDKTVFQMYNYGSLKYINSISFWRPDLSSINTNQIPYINDEGVIQVDPNSTFGTKLVEGLIMYDMNNKIPVFYNGNTIVNV